LITFFRVHEDVAALDVCPVRFNIFIAHPEQRTFPSLLALETLDLSKTYGNTDALRGLTFIVNEGEIMVISDPSRLRGEP